MKWHLFTLVWGDDFVRRFGDVTLRFLAMPGNGPALARDESVVFHVYTDQASQPALMRVLAAIRGWCEFDIRRFDESAARGLAGPEVRYALQRSCLLDLNARVGEGAPIVLLDPNLLLADGTFSALAARRRQGYTAASVSVLRVAADPFLDAVARLLERDAPVSPRELMRASLTALHHITRAFFVESDPFTPYPSQISKTVSADGFVNRNFLPHPLMFPAAIAVARSQSTMDYDLVLRSARDGELYVCADSDEMLAVKFTGESHHAARSGEVRPIPSDLGLFLMTATNRRHRLFAETSIAFHAGELDARYRGASAELRRLVDEAYAWIDTVAARAGEIDAKGLMYLKSHLGPIEDFMSPQLEPAALARLA